MARKDTTVTDAKREASIASSVNTRTRKIIRDGSRLERLRRNLGVLRNRAYMPLDERTVTCDLWNARGEDVAFPVNKILSTADTLQSNICATRPRVYHLPSDAGWALHRSCRQLDRWIAGSFDELRSYDLAQQSFRDSLWGEIGAIYVWHNGKRVVHERVLPQELWVDERLCLDGMPRRIARVKRVSIESLRARFPESAKDISAPRTTIMGDRAVTSTLVDVVEEHTLGDDGGEPGTRYITCGSTLLLEEEWKHDWLPYTFFSWGKAELGFYPQSLVEQLQPSAEELRDVARKIKRAIGINAMRILFEKDSIDPEQITNEDGTGIEVRPGTVRWPEVHAQPSVPSDAFSHVGWLESQIFSQIGISELSATAQRPPAEMSGKAYMYNTQIERSRHALALRAWDDAILDLADKTVKVQRLISGSSPKRGEWTQRASGSRRFTDVVDWADVPGDGQYLVATMPSAMLPTTVSGRFASLREMIDLGVIKDPQQAIMLLDMPDLDAWIGQEVADQEYIEWACDRMLYRGEQLQPDETDTDAQLDYADQRIAREIRWATMAGAREDEEGRAGLDRLVEYRVQVRALKEQRAAQQQAQAQMAAARSIPQPMGGPPAPAEMAPMAPTGAQPS